MRYFTYQYYLNFIIKKLFVYFVEKFRSIPTDDDFNIASDRRHFRAPYPTTPLACPFGQAHGFIGGKQAALIVAPVALPRRLPGAATVL